MIRVTGHFNLHRWSPSISWILPDEGTLEDAGNKGHALFKAHLGLMATGCSYTALTVSREAKPGTAATTGDAFHHEFAFKGKGGGPITFEALWEGLEITPDPPPRALKVICGDNNWLRRKSVYLPFPPDNVIRAAPLGPDIGAGEGWNDRFTVWKDYLRTNGFGWWARKTAGGLTARQQVLALQKSTANPALWGVAVSSAGVLIPAQTKVQLRGFKHYRGARHRWQGFWKIESVLDLPTEGRRVYFLENSQNLNSLDVCEKGTIEGVEYEVQVVQKIEGPEQAARKRGVGYKAPRGRSRPRLNFRTC